jgi:hypothetical protein
MKPSINIGKKLCSNKTFFCKSQYISSGLAKENPYKSLCTAPSYGSCGTEALRL